MLKPFVSHSQSMFYQWWSIFFRVEWNIPDVEEKVGWDCNDIQTSYRDPPVKVEKHLWGHSVQDFSPVSFVLCIERRSGEGWPEKTHCHHIVFGCWYCQLCPKEETASLLWVAGLKRALCFLSLFLQMDSLKGLASNSLCYKDDLDPASISCALGT